MSLKADLRLKKQHHKGSDANASKTESNVKTETTQPEGEEKKSLNIGLSWAILDDGQTALTGLIKDSLDNDFPEYDISYTLTNADGDISKQISDVESLLATDPDMIFIMNSVGDVGIIPAINACNDAGVPVGIGVSTEGADYTYLYEGFSQYACGQMQASYLESVMDKSTQYNIALVSGDAGNTAGQDRTTGFKENFVDKYDNANVTVSGEGNWNTSDTQSLVDDWLVSFPEINVVVCVNDEEAQGAINACKAAGRNDVLVLGIDGGDIGVSNVESGDQACTVQIDFVKVAKAAAEAMVKCATGELDTDKVTLTTENLVIIS